MNLIVALLTSVKCHIDWQAWRSMIYLDLLAKSGMLLVDLCLLFDLADVEMSHGGILAVDNLGQLLEGRAPGLDVHEVNEAEFEEDPALCKRSC